MNSGGCERTTKRLSFSRHLYTFCILIVSSRKKNGIKSDSHVSQFLLQTSETLNRFLWQNFYRCEAVRNAMSSKVPEPTQVAFQWISAQSGLDCRAEELELDSKIHFSEVELNTTLNGFDAALTVRTSEWYLNIEFDTGNHRKLLQRRSLRCVRGER